MRLILSSTSPARKMLLERLQLPFTTTAPDVDETPKPNETPVHLVRRLAVAKAMANAKKFPNALIIGCDSVVALGNEIESKPENHANAVVQLKKSSGKWVQFYSGLCLLNTTNNKKQIAVEKISVHYRKLTTKLIEDYLRREKPYHCAGSIKAEGLGVALFKEIISKDPTALIGLPLIRLIQMLEKENVNVISGLIP